MDEMDEVDKMKTTLNISNSVMCELKREAARKGTTPTSTVFAASKSSISCRRTSARMKAPFLHLFIPLARRG